MGQEIKARPGYDTGHAGLIKRIQGKYDTDLDPKKLKLRLPLPRPVPVLPTGVLKHWLRIRPIINLDRDPVSEKYGSQQIRNTA